LAARAGADFCLPGPGKFAWILGKGIEKSNDIAYEFQIFMLARDQREFDVSGGGPGAIHA
jgi:hypothetical protein